MWHNYSKNKPPKHVIIIADFGDYQERLILDRKGLWSEETKTYIDKHPNRWCIKK